MLKNIFLTLVLLSTTTVAKANDWDKVERATDKAINQTEAATEKALDDIEDAINEVNDDAKAYLEKPETKKFFKRVEVNSKRVMRTIGDGMEHFGNEIKEEFQDSNSAGMSAPFVVQTKKLTILRGMGDLETFAERMEPGRYFVSVDGQTANQMIPLNAGTKLEMVPTSKEDSDLANRAVANLNLNSPSAQYCVETASFRINDSSDTVAVHTFTECTLTEALN